jgi:phosphodiesterase/alkaline phosphatase D-like protein
MSDPTRRDFVRLVGAGAALASGIASCGDTSPSDAASAVLEPSSEGLIVAVWSRAAQSATVEVRDAGDHVTTQTLRLAAFSGSGTLALDGLAAGTKHTITIDTSDGVRLGPHVARTAPANDDPRPVRIALVADVDANPEFDTNLVDHIAIARPDVVVSLGDFPYTDNGPVAQTLETYRERHAEIRTLPRIRTLLTTASMSAIYDDHEFRNNWDASFAAAEPARYAAAMTVWDEFFPVRSAVGEVRYRAWRWGAHVECFMLDCRRFRSANAALDDERKTMLGVVQRRWFLDTIKRSVAPFKLVFTSVPLGYGTGDDHWTSFATERDAIFDALVDIPGIVFLSADQHFFAAHRHAYGIREFQVGPLARGLGTPGPWEPGVLYRSVRYNAGLLDIDADRMVVTGLGTEGERFFEETLTPSDLTPRR